VWCRRDSTDRYLFTGSVLSWAQDHQPGMRSEARVTINAVDITSQLANTPCPATMLQLAVLTDDPLVYYPLAEDSAATSGPTADASGNGRDSSYHQFQSVDTFLPGESGRKVKQVDLVAPAPAINIIEYPLNGEGDTVNLVRTAEVWMRAETITTSASGSLPFPSAFIVDARSANSAIRIAMLGTDLALNAVRTLYLSITDSTGSTVGQLETALPMNQPIHVAAVLDDTLSTFTVYLNGAALPVVDVSAGTFEGGTLEGVCNVQVSNTTKAQVAHLATYEDELSAERVLAHYLAGITGGKLQTAAARLEDLADFAGLVDAGLYDGSTMKANTYMAAADFSGSILDEMRKVMTAEQGRLIVTGDGVLTAYGRVTKWGPTITEHVVSQGTFGDGAAELNYAGFHREPASTAILRNIISITVGAATIVVQDRDSWRQWGRSAEQIDAEVASVVDARNLGVARLRLHGEPAARVDQLVVNLRGHRPADLDDVIDLCLALQIGWRLTAVIRPADGLGDDISEAVTLEGRTQTITRHSWDADMYLVPAHPSYTEQPWFILGDATYGRIGTAAGNQIPR
jgi:hypothetical protein